MLLVLVSCTKNQHINKSEKGVEHPDGAEACKFGRVVFNTSKRAELSEAASKAPKTGTVDAGGPVAQNATILLTFNGYRVAHTPWNTVGDIVCTGANLTSAEIEKIITRVKEDFAPFNVTVTTDELTYQLTNPQKRMRVIITESWEWHGLAGGVAFYDSFSWGNNTPCFVFSTLLSYNEKFIAEAISHEVGHTLGLRHQSSYNSSCSILNEFNEGAGEGQTGWAPIMGLSYYRNVTTWHKGKTTGCGTEQDDVAKITSVLGLKNDETGTLDNPVTLESSHYAVINNSTDADYYYIDSKEPVTITASPKCIGNDVGANMHLQVKVFKRNGQLVTTLSDPAQLTVSKQLEKGKYYVAVESMDNANQSRYGMLGNYRISIN